MTSIDTTSARTGGSRIANWLLAFVLLLGAAFAARADDCSAYPGGVLDGFAGTPAPSQIKIDRNCTIRNYPGGMSTNFTFDTNDPTPYLVIFDNVAAHRQHAVRRRARAQDLAHQRLVDRASMMAVRTF